MRERGRGERKGQREKTQRERERGGGERERETPHPEGSFESVEFRPTHVAPLTKDPLGSLLHESGRPHLRLRDVVSLTLKLREDLVHCFEARLLSEGHLPLTNHLQCLIHRLLPLYICIV